MSKKHFGEDEKVTIEEVGYGEVYTQRKKKREKIVIHNVDGTIEEYKTGILFTLEHEFDENNKCHLKIVGKHCNTNDKVEAYTYGLAHVVMAMVENEEVQKEMFRE